MGNLHTLVSFGLEGKEVLMFMRPVDGQNAGLLADLRLEIKQFSAVLLSLNVHLTLEWWVGARRGMPISSAILNVQCGRIQE